MTFEDSRSVAGTSLYVRTLLISGLKTDTRWYEEEGVGLRGQKSESREKEGGNEEVIVEERCRSPPPRHWRDSHAGTPAVHKPIHPPCLFDAINSPSTSVSLFLEETETFVHFIFFLLSLFLLV